MVTYVALLRGINVGGHTTVSMTELKVCFEQFGFQNVRTYINSGNVIFHSSLTDSRTIEIQIEKALSATFGHQILVVIRSLHEIKEVIKQLPSSWTTNANQKCNVIFLRHTIDNSNILKNLKPKEGIEEL